MFGNIFVLITLICVVKASVVINVYNDDSDDIRGSTGLEKCNWKQCIWTCWSRGFKTGMCEGGSCFCIKNDSTDQANTELEISSIKSGVKNCQPLECDQLCRRIGRSGGVCVNGYCKCDIFATGTELEISKLCVEQCNPLECISICRRLGRRGGLCIKDRCKCEVHTSNEPNNDLKTCDPLKCGDECHEIGYSGGMCVGGRCECNFYKDSDESMNEISNSGEEKESS